MLSSISKVLLVSLGLVVARAQADVLPSYGLPELQVRAHHRSTYQLPPLSYLHNTSPALNNKGDLAIKVMAVDGTAQQALWYRASGDSQGRVVYVAEGDTYVTDPSINDRGEMTFSPFTDMGSEGLLIFDSLSDQVRRAFDGDESGVVYFGFHRTLGDGTTVFRGVNKDFVRSYQEYRGQLKNVVVEGQDNFGVPSAYLFKPAVNNEKQWAFKVRVGGPGEIADAQADRIVVLNPSAEGYRLTTVAETSKFKQGSPYRGFGNAVSISDAGHIVFIAVLAKNVQALVLSHEGQDVILAQEGKDGISEIELFSPKVNSQGIVAFRAKSHKGLRGIYVASVRGVVRVIGEGDAVKSDLGFVSILVRNGFPGLAGEVDINDRNEIAFACVIADGETIVGDAVYKISPKEL